MKKVLFILFLAVSFTQGFSQMEFSFKNLTAELKKQGKQSFDDASPDGSFQITINNIEQKNINDLLQNSHLNKNDGAGLSLQSILEHKLDNNLSDLLKDAYKKHILTFNLQENIMDNDSATLVFSLVKKPNGSLGQIKFIKTKAGGSNSGRGSANSASALCSLSFLPSTAMQEKWFQKPIPTSPPALNKATRWMLEYDFYREDPVLFWKRTNKVAGTTCGSTDNMFDKKSKRKSSKSLEGVAKDIYDLDVMIDNLLRNITDTIAEVKIKEIKDKVEEQRNKLLKVNTGNLDSTVSSISLAVMNQKLELQVVKSLYPAFTLQSAPGTATVTNCCDVLYCIKESKRLSPAVGRNFLVSIKNYHPYRDSFALAVDYLTDRNLENAGVFTSAFTALTGSQTKGTTADSAVSDQKVEISEDSTKKPNTIPTMYDRFKCLSIQLDSFYKSKLNDPYLDANIIANSVLYIKSKMTEYLGITDFSEAGIVARGEALADSLKNTEDADVKLSDYFTIVREAAATFAAVAGYRTFENRSILIQNKDAIRLTLNRYRDGKLVSSTAEADKLFNTSDGFKIDFSLGLFGSGLRDRLFTTTPYKIVDTTFFRESNGVTNRDSIVSIDSVTKSTIIKDDHGKFDIGPTIFAHCYWRTGRDINFSGTVGLSVNQSVLPRIMLGGSLLIGRESRLVITFGGIWGQIKDIASGLYEGQKNIDITTYPNSTLPTKDVWKAGYFLGVSLNFGGFTLGSGH